MNRHRSNPRPASIGWVLHAGAALLLALAGCLVMTQPANAGHRLQITFARSTPAPSGQNQQGLTPEKKKSLSRLGPDEVFPGREQNDAPEKTARPAAPKPRPASKPTPLAANVTVPRPTPVPVRAATTPAPTPAARVESSPAPTIINAALTAQPIAAPPTVTSTSDGNPPYVWLLAATLAVFAALVAVLARLRRKLRADRSA